jgi:hypothetical protein
MEKRYLSLPFKIGIDNDARLPGIVNTTTANLLLGAQVFQTEVSIPELCGITRHRSLRLLKDRARFKCNLHAVERFLIHPDGNDQGSALERERARLFLPDPFREHVT